MCLLVSFISRLSLFGGHHSGWISDPFFWGCRTSASYASRSLKQCKIQTFSGFHNHNQCIWSFQLCQLHSGESKHLVQSSSEHRVCNWNRLPYQNAGPRTAPTSTPRFIFCVIGMSKVEFTEARRIPGRNEIKFTLTSVQNHDCSTCKPGISAENAGRIKDQEPDQLKCASVV